MANEATAKELTDRVVALGVGRADECSLYSMGRLELPGNDGHLYSPTIFVQDWRVAGALMEKLPPGECIKILRETETNFVAIDGIIGRGDALKNESLPRAITEVCCEALEK